ncbi:MAG: tRNA pseudouridine(55) synthase TruB [Candidatus Yanofskybacteria bacterium CG10_big_fil_rev_8_21_14_0_10_46_23]|uniref:tRNA pseudouridine synthase B n=1 Tax=Candidatus Yanofskybacteria bacterium CG10_big_fil_rev_8_21_14_0_10_46_23 TaxID=1975098 RepID=A0A2H0R4Y5_9BACT|nr:MAG: tRNA pseudouridine(55) synthase TruB [Candidatus Yanofskybacteria bacterium CG10_big_fil_rev_8_21_14_0_10_46_23]
MTGIFPIYKPVGPTSHDIVDQVRVITGERRVGHAGTLDPLASGILIVAVGREFTKELATLLKSDKEYVAEIRLGQTSATDDLEGELTKSKVQAIPALNQIESTLRSFVGEIEQRPPVFSSIKISGKPAHRLARRGQAVNLESRRVLIKAIKILEYNWPDLKLNVTTGPGVYIRALARDIGRILGVGGLLTALERTRVGQYDKKTALSLAEFQKKYGKR